MKPSDSVNSLTELNKEEKDEKQCFICLGEESLDGEPLVDSKLLRNCGCKFSVHPACWNQWMKDKSDYDCPLCRKNSMMRIKIPPNPVMAVAYQEEVRPMPCRWNLLCLILVVGVICFLVASIVLWG